MDYGAPQITANERQIFNQLLYPDDSYNEHGVYWADLPLAQKIRFVSSCDAKESKREASNIWKMFKTDPLSPVAYYFRNMVLPGAGLGLEGFVVAFDFLPLSFLLLLLLFFFLFKKNKENGKRGKEKKRIFFWGADFCFKTADMCSSPSVT